MPTSATPAAGCKCALSCAAISARARTARDSARAATGGPSGTSRWDANWLGLFQTFVVFQIAGASDKYRLSISPVLRGNLSTLHHDNLL